MEFIKLTQDGHIGTIVLDRHKKLNALSHDLVAEVIDALRQLDEGGARVVVLRAQAGAKVWSAGHDVGELPEGGQPARLRKSPRLAANCVRQSGLS